MKNINLVTIKTYADAFAAKVDKTVLDANNIKSMISADDCGDMRPHIHFVNWVKLIVREEDAQKANSILNNSQPGFYRAKSNISHRGAEKRI